MTDHVKNIASEHALWCGGCCAGTEYEEACRAAVYASESARRSTNGNTPPKPGYVLEHWVQSGRDVIPCECCQRANAILARMQARIDELEAMVMK